MPAQIVTLTAPDSGATADVLVSLGMNCFSWRSPFAGDPSGEPHELLWAEPGFDAGDLRPSRSGVPLLFPFPGRIAGPAFEFEGERYELEPTGGDGVAIHGFAMSAPWRVVEQASDRLTADFVPSRDAPHVVSQWPGDYRLEATYTIAGSELNLDVVVENRGQTPVPFGFATHAYFRLPLAKGSDPEATTAHAPVDGEWLSEAMIPTGEVTPVDASHPLNSAAPLAGAEYDTPFRLAAGGRTVLTDPSTGRRVVQTFDDSMTCCVVYTPDHREAICLEPYTCTPDPFAIAAKGQPSGLRVLAPGEQYTTRVGLRAETQR